MHGVLRGGAATDDAFVNGLLMSSLQITRPIPSQQVSTAYVVRAGADVVVIDTGEPGNAPHISGALAAVNDAQLRAIFITHAHPDHVGSLAAVAQATAAPVYASAHDAALIETGQPGPKPTSKTDLFSRFLYRKIIEKGDPHFDPCSVTHTLQHGDTLPFLGGIDVVALPGHSAGQIGFLIQAHGFFFVGDALMNLFGPRRMRWHEDEVAEVASLKSIASLDWHALYVGHGSVVKRPAFERMLRRL
jgi:glyoxylase-like metal-dependent hydrolase (beta-lactamase superfamily II)